MRIKHEDTIAAPATVPGTGALTIIRMSGPETFPILDKIIRFARGTACEAEGYTIKFGRVFLPDGSLLDEVLTSFFRAPHSYTGEDSAEISCHASSYICSSLMQLLLEAGAREAEPGEFSKRAFLHGKMDLSQAEAVADLIEAGGEAAHRVAMQQMKGTVSAEIASMRSALLDIASLVELELDFSEEDVEFANRERLMALLDSAREKVAALISSFKVGNAVRSGIPVVIAGAANSGKSTLLNAILGEDRALVSDVAGTTRDTVEECLTLGGLVFRFIDTAGLRETDDEVESMGIDRTRRKISEASVLVLVVDSSLPAGSLLPQVADFIARADLRSQKLFILANKADLTGDNKLVTELNTFVTSLASGADNELFVMSLSAKTGAGVPEFLSALVSSQKDLTNAAREGAVISNLRHFRALSTALSALDRVRSSFTDGLPTDLAAEDLRDALDALASVTGEITTDELLGTVFSRHCIGK